MSRYLKLTLLLWATLLASITNASTSTITFAEANKSNAVLVASEENADLLIPAAPNAAGVTVVRLTTLTLNRPLRIVNLTDDTRQAAKLIVIESTRTTLNSSIEIVGERADLLIFNRASSTSITCTQCSLINISRATLASASIAYDTNKWPTNLTLTSGSLISINNMEARGIGALELISPRVIMNGEINTQLKANMSSDGSFLLDDAGRFIVGTGNINVYAGFNFNYKGLDIRPTTQSSTFGIEARGTIKTLAAKLVSTNPINVSGQIDTTSDIASGTSYNGSVALIEESIKVATLRDGKNLLINGKLYTDNKIQLGSAGELIINGEISAASFEASVETKFTNRGTLNAKYTSAAAGNLENNGLINGQTVLLFTESALVNRFGGKILGSDIGLTSEFGYIRNGSQYPFKAANDFSLELTADSHDDIDVSSMAINGIAYQGATKVADLSAHIIGNRVTLDAALNVENINPYFEYTLDPEAWRSGIIFNSQAADRVQLIADSQLDIHARRYVINSSAIMGVNDPNGHFYIVAPNVANERYTTEAIIKSFDREETTSTSIINKTGYESLLVVFSPPGIMYSFAPLGFHFTTLNGGFINNTSYFEVLNNADFVASARADSPPSELITGKVTSIGVALQDKFEGSSTVVTHSSKGCTEKYSYNYDDHSSPEGQGRMYYSTCGSWASNSTVDLNGETEDQMRGTLFSVKGNLNGKNSEFFGTNHQLITDTDNDFLAAEMARNTWTQDKYSSGFNNQGGAYSITYQIKSTSKISDDGEYIVTTHSTPILGSTGTFSSPTGYVSGGWTPPEISRVTSQGKTIYQKVEDFLVAQYDAMKTTVLDWLAAFDSWWNS